MEGRNMKSVVITGSARGFGLEMAKVFRSNDYNVVISDILDKELESAQKTLESIPSKGKVLKVKCLSLKLLNQHFSLHHYLQYYLLLFPDALCK